jgi:hypothetical protein
MARLTELGNYFCPGSTRCRAYSAGGSQPGGSMKLGLAIRATVAADVNRLKLFGKNGPAVVKSGPSFDNGRPSREKTRPSFGKGRPSG